MNHVRSIIPSRIGRMIEVAVRWRIWVAAGANNSDRHRVVLDMASKFDATYYGYSDTVAQWELDAVCEAANAVFNHARSNLRITNRMGELIPAMKRPWVHEVTLPDGRTVRTTQGEEP